MADFLNGLEPLQRAGIIAAIAYAVYTQADRLMPLLDFFRAKPKDEIIDVEVIPANTDTADFLAIARIQKRGETRNCQGLVEAAQLALRCFYGTADDKPKLTDATK